MNRILISVALVLSATILTAQEPRSSATKYVFTLDDVVQLAKEQSQQAIMARHNFRANYYNFVDYEATFLPKLTFTTAPISWDKSIRTIPSVNNKGELVTTESKGNTFTSTAGLALSQNIGLTGGSISLGSDFSRIQNFLQENSDFATQYTTLPVRLSLSQPLNGYNQFTWLKKIEPLRYEWAKQNYIVQMESVSVAAVSRFFLLAIAQVNLKMSETNYANAQELYKISQGRYENGRIAEDALLQMELRLMKAESSLNSTRINIESRQSQLRSFLGFKDNVEIVLVIDTEVPSLKVPYDRALDYALSRNPDIISYNRQILEYEKSVALAKSQKGITMSLDASFGINKTGYKFGDAYSPSFGDREGISMRFTVPILDGSQSKNRLRNAESLLEATKTQFEQNVTDFKQDVYLQIAQFNMQENQIRIAAKADTIAERGYEISRERYKIGNVSITDLNIADTEKDVAKREYMEELQKFWNYYYTIRRLTLYDFLNNKPLEENFDLIIGD